MECKYCCYYWQGEDEENERCHWDTSCPGDCAPCEHKEYYYEEDEE